MMLSTVHPYPCSRKVSVSTLWWYGVLILSSTEWFASTSSLVRAQEFSAALASSCVFNNRFKRTLICQEFRDGANIKYSVPCPRATKVQTPQDCLADNRRICYQRNNIPCLGAFYCANTNRFALDCSNIISASTGGDCSVLDCFGNCISLVNNPAPYNQLSSANACGGLNSDYYIECAPGTIDVDCGEVSVWTNVLADGTEVNIKAKWGPTKSCDVRTGAGNQCGCALDCGSTSIRYDCSQFSRDPCASLTCDRQCVNTGGQQQSLPAPVNPQPRPFPVNPQPGPFSGSFPGSFPANPQPLPFPVVPQPGPVFPQPRPAPTSSFSSVFALPNSWTTPAVPIPTQPQPAPLPTNQAPNVVSFTVGRFTDGVESAATTNGSAWSWWTTTVVATLLVLAFAAEELFW